MVKMDASKHLKDRANWQSDAKKKNIPSCSLQRKHCVYGKIEGKLPKSGEVIIIKVAYIY